MIRKEVLQGQDKQGRIEKKDVILARSGIYLYSYDDLAKGGLIPKTKKPLYRMYRPAGVLLAAKDMFDLVPFCREHPPVDVTEDNFHRYASGATGGPIEAVALAGGEIGLKGRLAFFTKDAYDYYEAGNKEVSAGYKYTVREVKDADTVGYDYIMDSIVDVNHACVTRSGRGGAAVRVLDSKITVCNDNGGVKMLNGFLSFLGIGKAQDANFKFSSVLLESVAKVHSLDEAGLTREITGVMAHVKELGDSDEKELLVGAVTDCFKHPVEVIAQKDKVGEKIDALYAKCRALDAEAVKKIIGEGGQEDDKESDDKNKKSGEKKPEEKDAKDAKSQDFGAVIDAAVEKAVAAATDSFEGKIDASVRKALGLDTGTKPVVEAPAAGQAQDGAGSTQSEDASYLVSGLFGSM